MTMTLRLITGVAIGMAAGALMGHFGKCSSGACPLTANPFRGAIYGGVMGALFALSFAHRAGDTGRTVRNAAGEAARTTVEHATPAPGTPVLITTAEEFDSQVLKSTLPCLADFYSDGCGPCRMLAPTVEALAGKYEGRAVVCKVNLDANPALAQPYGIRGIPAVLLFAGGKEVDRLVGLQPQSAYERALDALVSKAAE